MKAQYLVSFLRMATLLAMTSCTSYEMIVREPMSLAPYSADKNVEANMVAVSHIRMALPEGWTFKRNLTKKDDESVLFGIQDDSTGKVMGSFRYHHFDYAVSLPRLAQGYGKLAMTGFIDKEAFATSVDNHDAYLLRGKKEDTGLERMSLLVLDGPEDVHDISLASVESNYFTSNPQVANTIFNSYKIVSWDLSERRLKGSFSFRCDDGSMHWGNDKNDQIHSKGFSVGGPLGRDYLIVGISQVSTKRFERFLNLARVNIPEFETEVRFAGTTYKARAVARDGREKDKLATSYFIFDHAGQTYALDIYRKFEENREMDIKTMHTDEAITRVLDTYFYFNG